MALSRPSQADEESPDNVERRTAPKAGVNQKWFTTESVTETIPSASGG